MKKIKRYVPVLAATLFLALMLTGALRERGREPLDNIQFWDQGQNQALVPYYDEAEDVYYLFLPACTRPADVSVSAGQNTEICLLGEGFLSTLECVPPGQTVEVVISRDSAEKRCRLRLEQCENLPALFLDMQPGGLEWLQEDKDRKQTVYARFVDADGNLMHQNSADLSGRGNGSWREGEKRPYNLSFSGPVSLGPFEDITTLCLMADYSDESRMRNALAYRLGQRLEIPYASGYMQTDVYVNGEYWGLYGICTKQEYTKRIDEDRIQAVFEITSDQTGRHFLTEEYGHMIRVMYGSISNVQETLRRLEQALTRQDWDGCWQLLDLRSFAKKYVLDEFMGNVDMGYASQYFYIGADGMIRRMLPWDYDWSLGSAINYFNSDPPYGLMTARFPQAWSSLVLGSAAFRQEVARILEEEYTDGFLTLLREDTMALEAGIESSRECDRLRWKNSEPYCWGASGFESLSDLTHFFNTYYTRRRDHLLRYFSAPEDFWLVEFECEWSGYYLNYLIPRGARLFDFLQDRTKLTGTWNGCQVLDWHTADGVSLKQLDVIERDMTLTSEVVILEDYWGNQDLRDETLMEKLMIHGGAIAVLGLFGLSALALLAMLLRQLRGRKRVSP